MHCQGKVPSPLLSLYVRTFTAFFSLQEHDCSLTREIVELVDREADLLVRGMKEDTLQGNI